MEMSTEQIAGYNWSSSKDREIQGYFEIHNRRFLGSKYKLLGFIEKVVYDRCLGFESFCDIFAGTGVVGEQFNHPRIKIIANDSLLSNYISLATFLNTTTLDLEKLEQKISYLNQLKAHSDNYFSDQYGSTYFTVENARKIGVIREEIELIADGEQERNVLITALIYGADKVANTVGHYDAFRKHLNTTQRVRLLIPKIDLANNADNQVFREDANTLIKKITVDVLYIDPPYNSRQYCDTYHLLENLAAWRKPKVYGKAKKMDRWNLKSEYCLKRAPSAFRDLIMHAACKHILISYNNTGHSKDSRSNARMRDEEIINILKVRGRVETFAQDHQGFTSGKSDPEGNSERIFYCEVAN